MADEALFASGGSYEADELRKLVKATLRAGGTGGVVSGMAVSPGVGLNVTIGPGQFVVNDSDGGAFMGYVKTAQTVSISGNTSGSTRTDTVYGSIDPTSGAVTFSKVTGPGSPPAGSTALASVAVPNNAVNIPGGAITNNGGIVEAGTNGLARFLRKDQADTLFAGTNAYTPTAANNVATKGYVDGIGLRTPHMGYWWGSLGGYDWLIPDGAWSVPPGAALKVGGMITGHMYEVHMGGFSVPSPGYYNVRIGMLWSRNTPEGGRMPGDANVMSQHFAVGGPSNFDPISLTQKWLCPASGDYWFIFGVAAAAYSTVRVYNGWWSPYTEVTDLGPMYTSGPVDRR